MKSTFKAKLLQMLANKKANQGFTLIELLVVIIIIGILSAIALPSFLNQANKARESESKQYIGSMNRGQQAYYLEKTAFTSDIKKLGLGIKETTQNYAYKAVPDDTYVVSYSNPQTAPNDKLLRVHSGVVESDNVGTGGEKVTVAVLCQSKEQFEKDGITDAGAKAAAKNVGADDAQVECENNDAWEPLDKRAK